MKRLFKCTLYALLCTYLSASVLTEALQHTNGYIVVRTIYTDPFQERAPEDKQIFQDILMYQKRTHHNFPMYSPIFTETIRHIDDSAQSASALQPDNQVILSRGKIEINRCNNSPYLTISHNAQRIMQNIMNISNIPFNCNGFFMDNQQKIKIDIPDNQDVTGMFFSEQRGTLYYLSFQKGYIYQLSEENLQEYFQDLSKKINELYNDSGNLIVVGYRFSNSPVSKDIDPEILSIPTRRVWKLYEENELISMGADAHYLNNTFSPFPIIQTTDFRTLYYNGFGGDDDDPEPFPIPAPGVGKLYYNGFGFGFEFEFGRDDDDPEPFPIPAPGVGKFHYNGSAFGGDDDDPEPFPIPAPGVGKSKKSWEAFVRYNNVYIKNRQYQ